jgi:hypothetical protein
MESFRSFRRLKRRHNTIQAEASPHIVPTTILNACAPMAAPMPVNPSNNQADSPVAREEKAAAKNPNFVPPRFVRKPFPKSHPTSAGLDN